MFQHNTMHRRAPNGPQHLCCRSGGEAILNKWTALHEVKLNNNELEFVLCCLMTPGFSKDIRCHVWPNSGHQGTSEMGCQLVIADGYLSLPQGLCRYIWVDILTLLPLRVNNNKNFIRLLQHTKEGTLLPSRRVQLSFILAFNILHCLDRKWIVSIIYE